MYSSDTKFLTAKNLRFDLLSMEAEELSISNEEHGH
jgi:hypothetical protein